MKSSSIWSRKSSITNFFGENGKASSLSLLSLKKFNSFVNWFDSCLSQALLSIWIMTLRNNEKKTTEAKKRKRRAFKLFFVASCLYATFFNLLPIIIQKIVFCLFPPQKKWKIETTSQPLINVWFYSNRIMKGFQTGILNIDGCIVYWKAVLWWIKSHIN